jgi:hypothetical protein
MQKDDEPLYTAHATYRSGAVHRKNFNGVQSAMSWCDQEHPHALVCVRAKRTTDGTEWFSDGYCFGRCEASRERGVWVRT